MAADWTAFAMADALKTLVEAEVTAYEPEVRVVTYLPSPDESFPDAIAIGYLAVDSEDNQRTAIGQNRFQEEVNLQSQVRVTRPGAGQDVADTARTRATDLLADVDELVRESLPAVGDQSWNGIVLDRDAAVIATIREGVGAMLCVIDFNINYKARTS